MDSWIIFIAIGILLVFGFLLLLFLVISNCYLDEMRLDWESRREQKHDQQRASEKRKHKKPFFRSQPRRGGGGIPHRPQNSKTNG